MTPLIYSRFLTRWTEHFDPALEWLTTAGSAKPKITEIQRAFATLTELETRFFDQEVRTLRNRFQAGIIYRLLTGIDQFEDTVSVTTSIAECALDASLDHHKHRLNTQFGEPSDLRYAVIGMGKLGGRELNLSSDIDIFCIFAKDGETLGPRICEHSEYFTRLTQNMVKSLDQITAEGFVARVDQRLRPWGTAGQLAIPIDACEDYYEIHGREWERFALLKARPVAGSIDLGRELLDRLKPFIFRKYLDFGVFESIRDLKAKIEAEVRRNGRQMDIKVGSGGIREIEFIVQALQLLRGGQIPTLQVTGCLSALETLASQNIITPADASVLKDDYLWLRQVEHVIQAQNDLQTQEIPADDGPLASMLGFSSAQDFWIKRGEVTNRVRAAFSEFMRVEESYPALVNALRADVEEALQALRDEPFCERLEPVARSRLVTLLSQLGPELSEKPIEVTKRMIRFISICTRRSVYLSLLSENLSTRRKMLTLLERSSWLTERLIEMPVLLDELLIFSLDDALSTPMQIRQELIMRVQRVDPNDHERFAETLTQFARGLAFRVAVFEAVSEIPLMKVSDQLTWIAEAVVSEVLQFAYCEASAKHGRPKIISDDGRHLGLSVLAYGKLGGQEMSYESDLDLVFVHQIDADAPTDGPQPIEGGLFLNRVVRRMIAVLETNTRFGKLYEIDTRLRPSGQSGLMVVSDEALRKYLDESAWTWELQAFVRARAIAGDENLRNRLDQLRQTILTRKRDPDILRFEVVSMREKMRSLLASTSSNGLFGLKHDVGGIVDIEFMVQYAILAHAELYPDLAVYTDNVRQLDALARAGCIDTAEAGVLKAAYVRYRALHHEAILAGLDGQVDPIVIEGELRDVRRCWTQWMKLS